MSKFWTVSAKGIFVQIRLFKYFSRVNNRFIIFFENGDCNVYKTLATYTHCTIRANTESHVKTSVSNLYYNFGHINGINLIFYQKTNVSEYN